MLTGATANIHFIVYNLTRHSVKAGAKEERGKEVLATRISVEIKSFFSQIQI
jgi:hypothetical protein